MSLPEVKLKHFFSQITMLIALSLFPMSAQAFFRNRLIGHLGMGRIDPIMSPGQASAHIHHLNGAKNLAFESDGQLLATSNCTTSILTQDKSAYWAPWMYFKHENGNVEPVNLTAGLTVYYKLEKRPDLPDANFTVFPRGFRMIAGSSPKRTWNGRWPVPDTSHWDDNDTSQAALAEKALGFNCLHYNDGYNEPTFAFPYLRDKTFIDTSCYDGLRTEILFPSCWDGVNLDSEDHKSHVAYPPFLQDGKCPDTHPVYLPIIFFETIWNTPPLKNVPGEFVLANGDPTGYGYHADFISAWDDGVLEEAMNDPTCTSQDPYHPDPNISGEVATCNTFQGHIQSDAEAAQCQLEIPIAIQHEQVDGLLSSLPGDVRVTGTRYEPGEQIPIDDALPSSASSYHAETSQLPQVTMSSLASLISVSTVETATTSVYDQGPTISSFSTAGTNLVTSTTTFTSQGYVVEMAIVQNIETITITATPSTTMTVTVNLPGPDTAYVAVPTSSVNENVARHVHLRKHSRHLIQGVVHL